MYMLKLKVSSLLHMCDMRSCHHCSALNLSICPVKLYICYQQYKEKLLFIYFSWQLPHLSVHLKKEAKNEIFSLAGN